MRLTPAQCVEILERTDEDLFRRGMDDLRRAAVKSTSFAEDGFWPGDMAEDILNGSTDELVELHWALERHYADLVRQHAGSVEKEDFYLFIAYARVVGIRMAYAEDMGFTPEELSFVLGALPERPDATLLEVGCGAGSLLAALADRGVRSLRGIDLSAAAIRSARTRLAPYGLDGNVECCTLEEFVRDNSGEQFDTIVMCDVLEHIPPARVGPFLDDVRSLLRPAGTLVLVTPNALSGPHDMTRDFHPDSTEPLGFHLREFRLREVVTFLEAAGFTNLRGVSHKQAPGYHGHELTREEIRLGAAQAPRDLSALRPASLSGLHIRTKLLLEPLIAQLPRKARDAAIEGLYYKGVACQKA